MSRLAAIAQQLQQTAQMREQLGVQKRELEEAAEAGVIAILTVSVQETDAVPTDKLRAWVEPGETCSGASSFDMTLKQQVVFQLLSNEGKLIFSYVDDNDSVGPRLELPIEELPDGQILMAWLKAESPEETESTEAKPEAEDESALRPGTPKMEIRGEYDSVPQKLMTLQRKLQQADDDQKALEQQLQQFQSASTATPAVEDVEDEDEGDEEDEEDDEEVDDDLPVTRKQAGTPRAAARRQRNQGDEADGAKQSTWQTVAAIGGLLYQHSAVFIFIGSAVAMHLYGDYASV